jgi:replication initiation and membrane attachment protein DnaB
MSMDSTEQQQTKPRFMKTKELLPEFYLTYLSPNAQRIYGTIWNRLNNYASDQIWLENSYLIERTRIRVEQLDPALSELSGLRLLEIVPGKIQNRYKITDPDEQDTQD